MAEIAEIDNAAENAPEATDKEKYKAELTPIQFWVAFENGTEPAFMNEYYNNHR